MMRAETEFSTQAVCAKAVTAETSSNNTDVTLIHSQLTSFTEILKGTHFQVKGQKGNGEATAESVDAR